MFLCARRSAAALLFPVVLTSAVTVAAEEPTAPPTIAVTWQDIVRLVDRHPQLAAGEYQVDAARAGVDAAGAAPNPTLEGTVGQARPRVGGGAGIEWGLALTLPLGWVAQRGSRLDAAEAGVDVTLAENKALRRDVLLQLRVLFWNLAYEQASVASLEALEAQTSALVQTVRRRVEKGEARPVEVIRVEIELEKVASELEAAHISLSARRAELALWLDVPPGKELVATADLGALPVAVDRATALARVRSTHPALAATRARTRVLEAEVDVERMARVPSFSLTGFADFELDQRAYGAGVAVDLPIWNWNSGRIVEAEASLAAGKKQTEATALDIDAAVIGAQAACRASVATASRFKDNVIPRSEVAASMLEKTYQIGEASLLEVIDARRTLLDAHRFYLNALAQAQIDCCRLDALVGEESK
ncbi:MAG: TolC family protein [Deltaproteobacteria bacterium]|nr:TolC family protein [Deltaproteobacteria bacterium]